MDYLSPSSPSVSKEGAGNEHPAKNDSKNETETDIMHFGKETFSKEDNASSKSVKAATQSTLTISPSNVRRVGEKGTDTETSSQYPNWRKDSGHEELYTLHDLSVFCGRKAMPSSFPELLPEFHKHEHNTVVLSLCSARAINEHPDGNQQEIVLKEGALLQYAIASDQNPMVHRVHSNTASLAFLCVEVESFLGQEGPRATLADGEYVECPAPFATAVKVRIPAKKKWSMSRKKGHSPRCSLIVGPGVRTNGLRAHVDGAEAVSLSHEDDGPIIDALLLPRADDIWTVHNTETADWCGLVIDIWNNREELERREYTAAKESDTCGVYEEREVVEHGTNSED